MRSSKPVMRKIAPRLPPCLIASYERVELKQGQTVVIDRGMAFDENIADIKHRKLHYIVASRQPERDRWLADFDDTDGFTRLVLRQPSPLNPAQKKTSIRGQDLPLVGR